MPTMTVCKSFDFAASHFLPNHQGRCKNPHGHNFRLEITVSDKENTVQDVNDPEFGMILDFQRMSEVVNTWIINKLDHTHLNDLFDNPTAENMCRWIYYLLLNKFPKHIVLEKVRLYETDKCYAELTA